MTNQSEKRISQKKDSHILVTSRSFIPSVLLLAEAPLKELQTQGKISCCFAKTAGLTEKRLNQADVVIFVRGFSDYELLCQRKAEEAGRRTVYILDDDLPDIPSSIQSADLYTEHTRENIREMIRTSSLFLTPSRNLLKKYGNLAKRAELIEEPSLADRMSEKEPSRKIIIGFAGSVDRTGDLNSILTKAVENTMKKFGDRVTFEFFGGKPSFADIYGFRHIPYTESYRKYCETMAGLHWDFALAPMPETEFHRYKHYNKYIEYAGYGIPGIYTDCEPYVWAVRDGENGILCQNTDEAWTEAITILIEDEALRKKLAENCRKEAEGKYSLTTCADNYRKLLESMEPGGKYNLTNLKGQYIRYLAEYTGSVLKKYGLRTPKMIMRKIK